VLFAHDTETALVMAAELVNREDFAAPGALDEFLDRNWVTPRPPLTDADVAAVTALRPRLRAVWEADSTARRAALINDLLEESGAVPYLIDHGGGWGWHLHVTKHDAPIVHRVAAWTVFGLADLVRAREESRLRRCSAPGCDAVFADLSKNRSRRYCDTGNCGNRQHVAAYRERRAALSRPGVSGG
jgi:predicted RNA-binding Zn ribbon-like protein